MPRRKQEIFDQKRQQIIEGALCVFSRKGFALATNRDVAEAAGINSPGLIYHYFKGKADLLRAVIEQFAPPMQLVTHSEEMMALSPAEALARFGTAYLRLVEDPKMGAALKLIVSEALRDPEFARVFGEVGPLRVWRFLADYLERQMEKGMLRRMDAALAARCFVGPLVLQVLTKSVLQLSDEAGIEPETLVAANVEIFLRGMQNTEGG